MDKEYTREQLLDVLKSYLRIINNDGGQYPQVVLSDIQKSIEAVLKKNKDRSLTKGSGDMIKWKRIEAGEYESKDGRFHIFKTWNRIYGHHWRLLDRNADDYHKGSYHEKTLFECKLKAEAIR